MFTAERRLPDCYGCVNSYTYYEYDARGNKTYEAQYSIDEAGQRMYHQTSSASYDALNRIRAVNDDRFTVSYAYDANGNIRRMASTYKNLDANGNIISNGGGKTYWYSYDNRNRFVITKGTLNNNTIVKGEDGYAVSYITSGLGAGSGRCLQVENRDGSVEHYGYDSNGNLATIHIDKPNGVTGALALSRTNDAEGNVLELKEYAYLNSTVTRHELNQYDVQGRKIHISDTATGENLSTEFTYNADGSMASLKKYENGALESQTTYAYELWDSYKQLTVDQTES